MGKICDIEQILKTFFVAQSIAATEKIFLQEFPVNSSGDGLVLIRRVGTGDSPKNIDIDTPIVRIWTRDTDPHESYLKQKAVGDLLHGLNPVNVTVGPTTSRLLFAQLIAGPDRDDDLEVDQPQHVANYLVRVAV